MNNRWLPTTLATAVAGLLLISSQAPAQVEGPTDLQPAAAPQITVPVPAAKPKSGYNTKVYEAESSEGTFTSTVKMVREVQGSWEVLFDAKSGVFPVDDNLQAVFVECHKDKTPVTVRYNTESNRILSAKEARKPASSQNPLGK